MKRCATCDDWIFGHGDRHTCLPKWRVWDEDNGEESDAKEVFATGAEFAAEAYVSRFVEAEDALRGPVTVWVVGNGERLRYRVAAEMRMTLSAEPVDGLLDDGVTLEVTRVATDGAHNACSALYGAIRRAAKALGYTRLVTYTLQEEPGASLRAAGWRQDAEAGGGTWSKPSRPRGDSPQLFADAREPRSDVKQRWVWP